MRRTNAERDEALAIAAEHGTGEAARRTGIPKGTIDSWVSRARMHGPRTTLADVQATALTVAERKARLASDLLDVCQRLKAQLFAPCVERKAMAAGQKREVEIVDIYHDQPVFSDQRQIMTSIAIAVDKIQILTGEATERIETLTGRSVESDALAVVDELAARRAS